MGLCMGAIFYSGGVTIRVVWREYHSSPSLKKTLHEEVSRHYRYYKQWYLDDTTIPMYLFLSGSGTGTGKPRNAAKFHDTVRQVSRWDVFSKQEEREKGNDELATRLEDPFVFHVSLEDFQEWECPWMDIGIRMDASPASSNRLNTPRTRRYRLTVSTLTGTHRHHHRLK